MSLAHCACCVKMRNFLCVVVQTEYLTGSLTAVVCTCQTPCQFKETTVQCKGLQVCSGMTGFN
jgi:hypothetical protein